MVTPERFHQRLRALGISTLRESGDYYGYRWRSARPRSRSRTWPMRTGRSPTGGARVRSRWCRPRKRRPQPAMDAAASPIVADILADRNARTTTFGMDSVLSTRAWSAVKTGTSKDMRDNWCVGFTARYTVGVWVGNSSGASMWDVSGTTGAAPVWQALVELPRTRATGRAGLSRRRRAAAPPGRAARRPRSKARSKRRAASCSSPAPRPTRCDAQRRRCRRRRRGSGARRDRGSRSTAPSSRSTRTSRRGASGMTFDGRRPATARCAGCSTVV